MKAIFPSVNSSVPSKIPLNKQRSYWTAIMLASLGLAGSSAVAQTNNVPAAATAAASGSSTNVTKLEEVTVVGKLDEARNKIVPDLGATTYTMGQEQIATLPAGENATFNQLLLRAPGVAEDSFGQLHVRNEHAFLQYRINDVILPEGITGFGSELNTRFANSVTLITGALPTTVSVRPASWTSIRRAARLPTAVKFQCMAAVSTINQASSMAARRGT